MTESARVGPPLTNREGANLSRVGAGVEGQCAPEGTGETVRHITASIASGNPEALARLYRQRFDEMYAIARRVTGRDEAFCLDVVQDAMMRVVKSMRPVNSEARLGAWLGAVVRSCAMDRLRSEVRRRRREAVAANRGGDCEASMVRPDEAADAADRIAWLNAELAKMDRRDLRLVQLRYRMGWTLAKIGAAVGLAPGAVDGRISRALEMMRKRAGSEEMRP